jgi:hypothetical protein
MFQRALRVHHRKDVNLSLGRQFGYSGATNVMNSNERGAKNSFQSRFFCRVLLRSGGIIRPDRARERHLSILGQNFKAA